MSELLSALDELAGIDLDELSPDALLDASRGEGMVLLHTSCHEGGFTIRRAPGTGRWHTYRPDGTEVLSRAGP